MINIITEAMPECVQVSGKDCPIYTDFRDYMELADVMESGTDEQVLYLMIGLFKEGPPDDILEALNKIHDFMNLNEDSSIRGAGKAGKQKPVFSFSTDMPYVLSGFRQYYGIDLIRISYMHWFEFNALLLGLPEDSELKKRIAYRDVSLSSIKDKEERKRIKRIQQAIAIRPKKRTYMTDGEIGAALG